MLYSVLVSALVVLAAYAQKVNPPRYLRGAEGQFSEAVVEDEFLQARQLQFGFGLGSAQGGNMSVVFGGGSGLSHAGQGYQGAGSYGVVSATGTGPGSATQGTAGGHNFPTFFGQSQGNNYSHTGGGGGGYSGSFMDGQIRVDGGGTGGFSGGGR